MILERIIKVSLPDRGVAFLTRGLVSGPRDEDPDVDALECEGYTVYVVDLMTLQISGNFFNLTIYDNNPEPYHKSYLGNEAIRAETHPIFMKEDEPLDISEPT